jgi:FlaG/FlaF family flagellin (archaellin)
VSDAVAMTLLVAITVVLAAVLYVLISGLVRGPGTSPIGSAFAIGDPVGSTCTAAQVTAGVCQTAGDQIFTLTIEHSSIALDDVEFEVKTPSGNPFTTTVAGGFALQSVDASMVSSHAIGAASALAMTSAFSTFGSGYSASSPIDTTMTVVVDTGVAAGNWATGQGDTVVALGIGSYSGTTSSNEPLP